MFVVVVSYEEGKREAGGVVCLMRFTSCCNLLVEFHEAYEPGKCIFSMATTIALIALH